LIGFEAPLDAKGWQLTLELLRKAKSMSMSPAHADGRVARRLQNRDRILDALFELLRSGRVHPTLREVAERAGVTPRTLFNHFSDVGALLLATAARGVELARSQLPASSSEPDPEARVREFFRGAVSFYENYAAIRWSTLTYPGGMPGFDARQKKSPVLGVIEQRVAELCQGFGLTLGDDPELRRALLVAVDPLAWRLLRLQQGLSRADAAAAMARSVTALIHSAL
jgi:TetR/AcrR family transcriptional regulator of autoinduction and epiphytic fitness